MFEFIFFTIPIFWAFFYYDADVELAPIYAKLTELWDYAD